MCDVEQECANKFIQELHVELIHPGTNKLYGTMKGRFNMKNLKRTIQLITDFCLDCKNAKKSKSWLGKIKGGLSSTDRYSKICSDILGPLDLSKFKEEGKGYVLTVTDTFSQYSKLIPIKKITSKR